MREAGWIEIKPQPLLLRPVNPSLEVSRLNLVAFNTCMAFKVDRVKVQPVRPGNERQGAGQLGLEREPRSESGSIGFHLDTFVAQQAPFLFEAEHDAVNGFFQIAGFNL